MKPEPKPDVANTPRSIRGHQGAPNNAPTNPAREAQSSYGLAPPHADYGPVPNVTGSAVDSHHELEGGHWPGQTAKLWVRDLLLHALTVSSGAVDAISFLALGKVFTAFMTGNIAFLGLRVAGASAPGAVAILSSMIAFAVGVYLSTLLVKPSEGSGVWPHRVTVVLAISLVAHAAFLAVWFASNGQPSIDVAHVLLALWALAMGIQSAAVRTLRVEGVFTTAATATVIFLVEDITKWSATVAERRRLAGVLISLFVGATAGGLLLVRTQIYAPVLPFAITVATVATAVIVMREPQKSH